MCAITGMPASAMVIVPAASSVASVMPGANSGCWTVVPEAWVKRSFSQASAAFETSSRTKISRSVYSE